MHFPRESKKISSNNKPVITSIRLLDSTWMIFTHSKETKVSMIAVSGNLMITGDSVLKS